METDNLSSRKFYKVIGEISLDNENNNRFQMPATFKRIAPQAMTDEEDERKVVEKDGKRRKIEIGPPLETKQTKRDIMMEKMNKKVTRI